MLIKLKEGIMRKNSIVFGLIASALLTGCVSHTPDDVATVEFEKVTIEEKPEAPAAAATSDENMEMKSAFDSVSELFKETDPEWNESEEYTKAVSSYEASWGEILEDGIKNHGEYAVPRVEVGYIDEDGIPELLLSYGDYHVAGVCVYTYDPSDDKPVYIGEFSSFGRMTYAKKKNRILSSYGNGGYYTRYYTKIENHRPVLVGCILDDNSWIRIEKQLYYYGFDMPEWVDGSREAFRDNGTDELAIDIDDSDEYLITEEEYKIKDSELRGNPGDDEEICVTYDDMMSIRN
jgi:hypothetical protein